MSLKKWIAWGIIAPVILLIVGFIIKTCIDFPIQAGIILFAMAGFWALETILIED